MLFAEVGEALGGILGVLLVAWGLAQLGNKIANSSDQTKMAAAKGGWSLAKWLFK